MTQPAPASDGTHDFGAKIYEDWLPQRIPIPVYKGYTAFVDYIDSELSKSRWRSNLRDSLVYVCRTAEIEGKPRTIRLHRVIMSRMLGRDLLPSERVDHIDGDPLNNCRSNLRIATYAQNSYNARKRKDNTSGYKGVCWEKNRNRWRASIKANGKARYLGVFDTPEAAHEAYCKAAKELHGEFARLE